MNIRAVNRIIDNLTVILEQVIVDDWEYLIDRLGNFEVNDMLLEDSLTINDFDHTVFIKSYAVLLKDLKDFVINNSSQ